MLKTKVIYLYLYLNSVSSRLNLHHFQASELQRKIENAGGERLKSQKSKVQKIQSVSILNIEKIPFDMMLCLY